MGQSSDDVLGILRLKIDKEDRTAYVRGDDWSSMRRDPFRLPAEPEPPKRVVQDGQHVGLPRMNTLGEWLPDIGATGRVVSARTYYRPLPDGRHEAVWIVKVSITVPGTCGGRESAEFYESDVEPITAEARSWMHDGWIYVHALKLRAAQMGTSLLLRNPDDPPEKFVVLPNAKLARDDESRDYYITHCGTESEEALRREIHALRSQHSSEAAKYKIRQEDDWKRINELKAEIEKGNDTITRYQSDIAAMRVTLDAERGDFDQRIERRLANALGEQHDLFSEVIKDQDRVIKRLSSELARSGLTLVPMSADGALSEVDPKTGALTLVEGAPQKRGFLAGLLGK